MTTAERAAPGENTLLQRRVDSFAADVLARIRQAIADHEMTYDEYAAVKRWLISVGEAGEWPLFLDVWIEHAVEQLAAQNRKGSQGTILGPFYLPDAPELPAQSRLPMRADEPGDRLTLSGQVRDLHGAPLAGAILDMWQADSKGCYSAFHPSPPVGNLRGRVRADGEGRYQVTTVVPGPYTIPLDGPCGALCRATGWSPWRPGHLHLIVSAPGHEPLTTQLFFAGEDHLGNDIASAVKPELITDLVREPNGAGGQQRFSAAYDFVLEPARS